MSKRSTREAAAGGEGRDREMTKSLNAHVMRLLADNHPRLYSANQIVRRTGLSFTTVRDTLNRARNAGYVERYLDIGLNGHTLYMWYYCGCGEEEPPAPTPPAARGREATEGRM